MTHVKNTRPTMRERMVAEARTRSSSEGIPFTKSMDISANIEGFDDWAHYEDIASRSRSIGGFFEAVSIMAGRSRSKDVKPLFVSAFMALNARWSTNVRVPRPILEASLPVAILITTASIFLYALAFIDRDFIQTTSLAGMFCSFSLVAIVTCGRNMIAASRHPRHRSTLRICAMTGYLLGIAMPAGCALGLMTATEMLTMDHVLVSGLVASALAGPFWLMAVVGILIRREGDLR